MEALRDVSFEVKRGETFGVIGPNGCGKSTLLKLVAGIFRPSSGTIGVNGRVSALIELGAGFHPEITGRENVVINGVMLGLTRAEIERKMPSIIEFSGLEKFIDEPVKTYSSGMYVRLGFAVAIHVDPEILVVDEVLAVGDEAFANRCLDTIRELSARGRTIFFVSHALSLVEDLCDRVLYLKDGKVRGLGDPREMLSLYRLDVAEEEGHRLQAVHVEDQVALQALEKAAERVPETTPGLEPGESPGPPRGEDAPPAEKPRRWGDGSVVITACRLLGENGEERYAFRTGETLVVEIEAHPRKKLTDFVFGVGLFTTEDVCLHGSNTDVDELAGESFEAPARVRVALSGLRLGEGTYLLDVAVHAKRGTPYDYWRGACRFRVSTDRPEAGLLSPVRRWETSGGVVFRPR